MIDRALERTDLSEIDYRVWAPGDGAGALSFGPTAAPRTTALYHPFTHLPTLLETTRWLESAEDAPRSGRLRETGALLREGATAMDGARSKSVVEDDTGLWLAKFPARGDRWNNAPVEAGLLALARRCGITTPATRIVRVGPADVLLVQRFDRVRVPTDTAPLPAEPTLCVQHRVVSALTVLDADDVPHRREGVGPTCCWPTHSGSGPTAQRRINESSFGAWSSTCMPTTGMTMRRISHSGWRPTVRGRWHPPTI